jgi:hypothetical protein
MTVVCFKCKQECYDYYFMNIGNDIFPICSECSGKKKIMESIVSLEEARLERAWNGKDTKLDGWFK